MVCNGRRSSKEKRQAMEKIVKEGKAQWNFFVVRDFSHIREVLKDTKKCAYYDNGFPVVYKDRKIGELQFYKVLVKDRERGVKNGN